MSSLPQHSQEDRLLEFAYGELPPAEARAVEAHLLDCARCTQALQQIRSVRTAMAPLAEEPVPDTGLDSLLAYAQHAAHRSAAGPAPARRGWRRLVMPVAGLAAASLFGLVVLRTHEEVERTDALSVQAPRKDEGASYGAGQPSPAPAAAAVPLREEAPSTPEENLAKRGKADLQRRSEASAARAKQEAAGEQRARRSEAKKAMPEPLAEAAADQALEPPPALEDRASAGAAAEEQEVSAAPAGVASAQGAPGAGAAGAVAPRAPSAAPAAVASAPAPRQAPGRAEKAKESRVAQDPDALVRQAQAARASGDRAGEAAALRQALAAGAPARTRLLLQLCEAEQALGRTAAARDACQAVLDEGPGSADARAARGLLQRLDAASAPAQ